MPLHPHHPLAVLAGWFAAVALAAGPAASPASDDADPADGGFCTATAKLVAAACSARTTADAYLARAKCVNVADTADRAACRDAARDARRESTELCGEQYESRIAACARLGEARYDPRLDPSLFDADFRHLSNPNPYYPLAIGNRWEYRGGDERNTIEVLDATKAIAGLTCIVVRDLVYEDGTLVEATDDWFAAARDGSTWYCGEEVKNYEHFAGDRPRRPELVDVSGSFKHGRNRDKAGIIMAAAPRAGWAWREEFSLANAEDMAEVLSASYHWGGGTAALDRHVPRELVQRLCHHDCVVTRNRSLLEPDVFELKYYARGIGFIVEIKSDEGLVAQLVGCNFDARCVALPAP